MCCIDVANVHSVVVVVSLTLIIGLIVVVHRCITCSVVDRWLTDCVLGWMLSRFPIVCNLGTFNGFGEIATRPVIVSLNP